MRFHDWLLWEKIENCHEMNEVNFALLQWIKTKVDKFWKIKVIILNLGSNVLILLVMIKAYYKL